MTTAAAETTAGVPVESATAWGEIAGLAHGFFGRRGGVSHGPFESLNVSQLAGDDPAAVADNWKRAGETLSGLPVIRGRQVHGTRVVRVEDVDTQVGEADGLIARTSGFAVGVLTADCVPLLCVAPSAHAVMALHAGWRGALAGIAAIGLRDAQEWLAVSPAAWHVAMGPAIGGCCYEVEASLGQQFVDRWGAMPDAWQRSGSHGRLDLRAATRHILIAHGVAPSHIVQVGGCSACHPEQYFSHRRSGGHAARQLSAIGWI